MRAFILRIIVSLFSLSLLLPICGQAQTVGMVTDMRGIQVALPGKIERVATIDDGFVEGIMTHIGVINMVDVIGSWSMKRDYKYDFEGAHGQSWQHRGWNTMKFLHPWLDDKVCINSPQGNILNFEALAKAAPDVVILRVGDCTVGAGDRSIVDKTISTIEALGIPLIVTYAPTWYKSPDLSTMRDEARVIGDIFGQGEQAAALVDSLSATEKLIRSRTANIPDAEKSRVLLLGLDPNVRQQGASGRVWGTDTSESYIVETVAGATNVFRGKGSGIPLSAEQIYALDPDVIILPTYNGYHPPRELYESPYYQVLSELRAIKNKRVYAMPWSPMNCARRVEYPLDMLIIAKAAYPEIFRDIKIYDYALELYKNAYHVDDETARGLRTTQLLDWMKEIDF